MFPSHDPGVASWESPSRFVEVSSFEFTGQIIFMTNFTLQKLSSHMSALMSRLHTFQLDLDPDEVLAWIRWLAIHKPYHKIEKKDRLTVYRFLRDHQEDIGKLNLRDYVKALDIFRYNSKAWRKLLRNSIRHA